MTWIVENLPVMWETCVWSVGQKDCLQKGILLQYCCLENFLDRRTWWAIVHGVGKVRHDWEIDTQAKNKYEINEIRNSSLKKISQCKVNKTKPKRAKIQKVTLAKSCLSCISTDSLISIFPISFTLNIKQPFREYLWYTTWLSHVFLFNSHNYIWGRALREAKRHETTA